VASLRGGESVEDRVARLAEAARRDPHNVYVSLDVEAAMARARALDRGPREGRLFGLVVSVKDNLAVAGQRMTCGSRVLETYVAPYTATVVERLEREGAVVLGKTNLDEFACGSSGENSAFGPTRNPRDSSRVPGGSSSGAGASVAAGLADLAVGSDTGGSVRCPAAFCGASALKPSYGLVSRHGLADLAMSLESPAPIAASSEGLSLFLDVAAGPDPRDPVTRTAAPARAEGDVARPRFALVREMFVGVDADVERRVREAASRLAPEAVEVSIPALSEALGSYYLLNYAEFASAMQRYDGYRYGARPGPDRGLVETTMGNRAVFGPEVRRRIALGTYVTMKEHRDRWYGLALAARERVRQGFERAFREADLLLAPTMPFAAFRLGERVEDPLSMYAADVLTVAANLAGIPAASTPVRSPGLPVGLQVLGPRGADRRVLSALRTWEAMA